MNPSVDIETSIVSYLRTRPCAQVVAAARQILTRRWWENERGQFRLVTSQFVLDESAVGDPVLSKERLLALTGIPLLDLPPEIVAMAKTLLDKAVLPRKAQLDALHISTAAFHRIDYLLTWNCTHIANARILPRVRKVLDSLGYTLPYVCTPEEMFSDD